jgi:hypothetical protein
MMKMASIGLLALIAGCATTNHDETASLLAEPVNCEIAEGDIAALKAAMPYAVSVQNRLSGPSRRSAPLPEWSPAPTRIALRFAPDPPRVS